MLYSPSTGGFYHPQIHAGSMPFDAVEITDARHAELIAGQTAGRVIAPDADGAPILIDPPPPSIDAVRSQATSAMEGWINQFLAQFTAGVPAAEVASWPVKAERARQHLAGKPQAMIMAEAAITGEDAGALAQMIVAKAAAYEAIISRTTGLRRATGEAIENAQTPEAVAAVLAGARAQANEMAAQMGLPTTP